MNCCCVCGFCWSDRHTLHTDSPRSRTVESVPEAITWLCGHHRGKPQIPHKHINNPELILSMPSCTRGNREYVQAMQEVIYALWASWTISEFTDSYNKAQKAKHIQSSGGHYSYAVQHCRDSLPMSVVYTQSVVCSAYDKESNLPGHFKHFMSYWRLSRNVKHVLAKMKMRGHFHERTGKCQVSDCYHKHCVCMKRYSNLKAAPWIKLKWTSNLWVRYGSMVAFLLVVLSTLVHAAGVPRFWVLIAFSTFVPQNTFKTLTKSPQGYLNLFGCKPHIREIKRKFLDQRSKKEFLLKKTLLKMEL